MSDPRFDPRPQPSGNRILIPKGSVLAPCLDKPPLVKITCLRYLMDNEGAPHPFESKNIAGIRVPRVARVRWPGQDSRQEIVCSGSVSAGVPISTKAMSLRVR